MKLVAVELRGYRRFEQSTRIAVDGKLTALVGPNEAGKSSILDALERLDDDRPIDGRDRSRGTAPDDGAVAVEALWLIQPDDLAAIDTPNGSDAPRWLTVRKEFAGGVTLELIPSLRRDRMLRARAQRRLRALRDKPWLARMDEDVESEFELAELDLLVDGLLSEADTLTAATFERLDRISEQLDTASEQVPKYAQGMSEQLRLLAAHEKREHPTVTARQALYSRTPDFLRFSLAERALDSSYDLSAVAEDPPAALRNLAELAGLDLVALRDAVTADDRGLAVEIRDRANARLKERIDEAWDQATVEPRFETDDHVLRILVRTGEGGLQDIAQRSEGLRAFIALVGFTIERVSERPAILLIDEAEIHLHYDAQADLVQMLSHQKQAPQVIYTTHSVGCLPQDLGTGVRIVVPSVDYDRSTVENWPWATEDGFGPLLLGMGASTLAFVPTRGAVIGEGAGEVVLLPTLIREALDLETLDYQVAPGASEASKSVVAHLDFQGQRVVWLVDGDEAGRRNRTHLERSGIPSGRILTLGGEGSGLEIEDLVCPTVFLTAVNEELHRSAGHRAASLRLEDLTPKRRWTAVRQWCRSQRLSVPNKGAVAHRIADQRLHRTLISPEHLPVLRALHDELAAIFMSRERRAPTAE